ncbi:YtxH domain-containing protein [Mucilaginibacter sp. CAU 1740]|uniref:YtxH domain-containing protein n=1 Tax=Mucilaginibacter sp. CAU 1740 TaxID=3140365 RepID=UPI00325B0FF6
MKESKVIVALLAGLAAGAALGILFAPGEGTETRDKLCESLTRLSDSIKETAGEQLDKLTEVLQDKVIGTIKEKLGFAAAEEHPDDLEHA